MIGQGFNILLVDDDQGFREIVKMTLERQGFEVIEADNGRSARELIKVGKFSLILSDIQMPHFTGIELLEWVSERAKIPVILMTGFSRMIETLDAHSLGASAFLSKPFQGQELIDVVKQTLGIVTPEQIVMLPIDTEYCKVSIEDFVMGQNIPFSIFIRFSEKKYVKIAHKGQDIEIKQIRSYKSKGIDYLYVKKEDYLKLVGFTLKLAKTLSQTSEISVEKKRHFLKYTGEVLLEQAFVAELDQETFQNAKDFVETSLSVLSEDDASLSLLMSLNAHSDTLYSHSIGVSYFAVMVAKAMGWTSPVNAFRVSLAALFHDIGKKEIARELVNKARPLLTAPERALIEGHVTRGSEILQSMHNMPDEVVQSAYQHHENCTGKGYPRQLKKLHIHPFAKLISLANVFCEYVIAGPNHDAITCEQAIVSIRKFHADEFDPEMLKALEQVVSRKPKT
jgi:putative nucleotidyltransferase with HDIG domain